MKNIPEKCTRCGAPISWEEGASVVKCEFCGYKNNLKDDFLSLFKNYLRLRDPKKIIRNPFSLILVLPIIFLFLILNSPIKKQEKIKAEYWPTNWDKLKQTKFKGGITLPSDFKKDEKDSKTIYFKSDIREACKYRNLLIEELKNFELKLEKSKYEFNIRVGNKGQFGTYDLSMNNPVNNNLHPGLFKSSYFPGYTRAVADKEITINNFKRINNKLLNEGKNYWDFYINAFDEWKEKNELYRIIDLQENRIFASNIEVLRQTGEKNWQLYSRWYHMSVGDLATYYDIQFKNSKQNEKIRFDDWLIKKRILDKSHFNQIQGKYYLKNAFGLSARSIGIKSCEAYKF